MKYLLLIILFLTSCSKTEQPQPIENKPVLIQVEAIHIDGEIVLSPIVIAR